ncbi:NERD domain-containing protein [Paenibacillus sp. N4]|uniref:nuclease-related domain-containing protein n=1 Tax=Paenibacillus vietnamensis TaxID=2590547 RepID=UPI001CD0FA7A|nr:nuclease-related domain-containing protein [Paenibacillus vietnamensis]MCA0757037.1 NERD domain-containing protein [Paenibacillus vietnamensis]
MLKKLLSLFHSKPAKPEPKITPKETQAKKPAKPKVAPTRIGELGEHKISIQLDQLSKQYQHLNDLLIPNPKARSGYSQIDHLLITPYAIFVIETKNYNGEIKGTREDRNWSVSNRFKMYNPLMQNYGHIKAVEQLLNDYPNVRYISMISFTMRCRFSIDPELRKIGSDELIVYDVELTEFIERKLARLKAENPSPRFTDEEVRAIKAKIASVNITDPAIRTQHIEKSKIVKSTSK